MKKVIIIGAGILGATTAYQLAKSGQDVIIIDRHDEGQATKAAAGIISPWFAQRRNKAWYELAKNGAKMYPDLIAELERDGQSHTGYKRVGAIRLHDNKKILKETKDRVLKRKENAPEIGTVTMLNKQETNAMFPLLNPIYDSLHISGAARVDGQALQKALLNAAKKYGAKMIKGHAIIEYVGHVGTGIRVNNQSYKADVIIATAGAWMNKLFEPLNIPFNVTPQKAQLIHLEVPDMDTSMWPVIMPPNNQYMLTLSDQRLIIGATHETKAGFDIRKTAGGIHEVLSKALKIAPGLANSTVLETKVGFRPFTPGSLPIFGSLPGYKGILLANGLGASGLTTGPYIGTLLAKLALGEKVPINMENYDVSQAMHEQ